MDPQEPLSILHSIVQSKYGIDPNGCDVILFLDLYSDVLGSQLVNLSLDMALAQGTRLGSGRIFVG